MQKTIEIILQIEAEKMDKYIEPHHATVVEVSTRYPLAQIEELEQAGKITTGETINSRYIHVKGRHYETNISRSTSQNITRSV